MAQFDEEILSGYHEPEKSRQHELAVPSRHAKADIGAGVVLRRGCPRTHEQLVDMRHGRCQRVWEETAIAVQVTPVDEDLLVDTYTGEAEVVQPSEHVVVDLVHREALGGLAFGGPIHVEGE